MGNTMVSGTFDWTASTITLTFIWCSLIICFILKFIIIKPWSSSSYQRRAIVRNNKKREDEFQQWKDLVETQDEGILASRKTIIEMGLFELRDSLQSEKLTAVKVLEAYVWKMIQVQERINACTVVIKEAFDLAKELDETWAGKPDKPILFGIPFSVKDNFYMKDYDCNIGLAKFLEQPKREDCTFVTHLRRLGAVPFVRANVPQALLSFVCSNTVYGTTLNPNDTTRSPGGSSGGDAALLAAGGTPFATGSDLAGSLRIPATFCGVVTLKPTQDRFVVINSHGGCPGRGRLGLSFGFFTRSVEEQIFLLKTTMGTEEYRKTTPLGIVWPLNPTIIAEKRSLTIGYFDFDGFCRPAPCMRRSVMETVDKLKTNGHTLVRFTVPEVDHMVNMLYKAIMPDGGAYCRSLYDNDIVDPYLKQFATLLKVPRCVRWLASLALSRISPQLSAISQSYVSGLEDLRFTQEQIDEYRIKFINYWKSLNIDALICPSFIVPAVPHNYPARLSTAAVATGLFNLVDFPAGIVPTGVVTHEDDTAILDEKEFPVGYNLAYRDIRESSVGSVGLPTSVQIVTLPFEEEICLRLMKEVEQLWKN